MMDKPKNTTKHTKIPIRNEWLKNVGRSLGMSASEMFADMTPASLEFTQSSFETANEIYTELRENKVSSKKIINSLGLNDQVDLAKQGWKNTISDLKSGKIYNKERTEAIFDDGDDDFGMTDFNFDDDMSGEDKSSAPSKTVINVNDNSDVVDSINTQTQVLAQTHDDNIRENRQQIATGMMMSRKSMDLTVRGFSTINDNLGLIVNYQNTNMTQYINASIEYYDKSLQHLSDSVEQLKLMVSPVNGTAVRESNKSTNQWEDVLLSEGGLNIGGYIDTVRKNVVTAIDEDLILSSIKSMITDTDTMKYMLASPLSFVSNKIVKSLIPLAMEDALKKFDNTMANFFPAMLMKITDLTDNVDSNMFQDMIGKVFGVKLSRKNDVDTSIYEKNKVPFDGITRKAITEVIPTYLRKILAAVSGNAEMAYDYESGKFNNVFTLKKNYEDNIKHSATSGYSDVMREIRENARSIKFSSSDDEKSFSEGVELFFQSLGKGGKFFNPLKAEKGKFNDVYDFEGNSGLQTLFRGLMKTLDRETIMKLNSGTLKSRQALNRLFESAEEKFDGATVEGMLNNDSGIDDIVDKVKSGSTDKYVMKHSPFLPKDKYNLSSLDYLRRIEGILMKGVRTFPISNRKINPDNTESTNEDINLPYDKRHIIDDEKFVTKKFDTSSRQLSDEEKKRYIDKGIFVVDNSYDLADNDTSVREIIKSHKDIQNATKKQNDNQKDSFLKRKGSSLLNEENQTSFNEAINRFTDMISSPGKAIAKVIGKLDNVLFNLVFGTNSKSGEISFIDKMITTFSAKLTGMMNFFNEKILSPLHEKLFGEDGLFNKVKQSPLGEFIKDKFKSISGNFLNFVMGEKDSNGVRQNGLFSGISNNMSDLFNRTKALFNGKYKDPNGKIHYDDNNVFSTMKNIFTDVKTSFKEYLSFGGKSSKGDKEPIGLKFSDMMVRGATNFTNAIFGDNSTSDVKTREMLLSVKKDAPKILTTGILSGIGAGMLSGQGGFLASLFLPGGPVGGAIMGMGVHMLTKSERFMETMFGPKDNDKRLGGIISRKTMDFLSKNKSFMVGGAALGFIKNTLGFNGLGILPNFLLPGGPIGGALTGAAMGLLTKTATFQKLMFGTKDLAGNFAGGLLSTFKNFANNTKAQFKGSDIPANMMVGALGGAGLTSVISSAGLLGSWFTPIGPIGGALMGAAAGIALGSKKWREAMFGKIDSESGKREGGVLGFAGNYFSHHVINPIKDTFADVSLNMKNWFAESIAFPFREALYPIKREISYMVERVGEIFKNGWKAIHNGIVKTLGTYVVKPIGDLIKNHFLTPMKKFLNLGFKTALGIFKMSAAFPFKIFKFLGDRIEKRQGRRGKRDYIRDLKEQRKEGKLSPAEYLSKRFNRQAIKDAKTLAKTDNKDALIKEAKDNGISVTDLLAQKRKAASDKYKQEKGKYNLDIAQQWMKGELVGADGKKQGMLDMLGRLRLFDNDNRKAMMEAAALGNTERYAYYKKLEDDKKDHRSKYEKEMESNRIKKSRRGLRDKLNKHNDYSGFVKDTDENGTVKSKITTDKILDVLGTSSKDLEKDGKLGLIKNLGKQMGIKNLHNMFTEDGLDMGMLGKKQRKLLTDGLLSGKFNEELKEISPYSMEQKQNETLSGIESAVVDGSDKVVDKLDDVIDAINAKNGNTKNNTMAEEINNVDIDTDTIPFVPSMDDMLDSNDSVIPSIVTDTLSPSSESEYVPNFTMGESSPVISPSVSDYIKNTTPSMPTNLPSVVTNSMGDSEKAAAMIIKEDNKDDLQAKKDIKNQAIATELEGDRNHASRLTADFILDKNRKKDMAEFLHGNELHQSTMLSKISEMTSKSFDGFDWAFGKKGVLTLLFLLAIPLLLKLLKFFNPGMGPNGLPNPPDNTNHLGDTIDRTGLIKPFQVGGLKGIGSLARFLKNHNLNGKISGAIGRAWQKFLGKVPGKVTNEATEKGMGLLASGADNLLLQSGDNLVKQGADNVGNKLFRLPGDVAEESIKKSKYSPTDIIDNVKYEVVDDAASEVVENTKVSSLKKFVQKIKQVIMSSVDTIVSIFKKLLPRGKKGLAELTKVVKDACVKMCQYLDMKAVLTKLGSVVGSVAGLAFESAVHLLTDKYFVAYGAITGFGEAHRLFAVNKSNVDFTMRAIASAFKALMGYKFYFLIEIVNEIVEMVTDWSFFRTIAVCVYSTIALVNDNVEMSTLTNAMKEFDDDLKTYREEHGINMSKDVYVDMTSKFMSEHLNTVGDTYNTKRDVNTAKFGVKYARRVMQLMAKGGGTVKDIILKDASKLPMAKTFAKIYKQATMSAAERAMEKQVSSVTKQGVKKLSRFVTHKTLEKAAVKAAMEINENITQEMAEELAEELMEKVGKFTTKGTAEKVIREAAERAGKETLKDMGEKVTEGAAKAGFKETAETVGKKTASETAEKVGKKAAGETAEKFGKETIKQSVETGKQALIDKFFKIAKQAITKMGDAFEKYFPKVGKKVVKSMMNVLNKVTTKMLLPFTSKIASGIARCTGGVFTAGLWNVIEFGFGALTNVTDRAVADFFEIDQAYVDHTMRTITSISQGFLSVSWAFVIDILNDVWTIIGGEDFLKSMATEVYNSVCSQDAVVQLEDAQIALAEETKEFNAKNGTQYTTSEYSADVKNQSMFQKFNNKRAEHTRNRKLEAEREAMNKKYGTNLSKEEYIEWKTGRGKYLTEEVMNDEQISMVDHNTKIRKKEALNAGMDEKMAKVREIYLAAKEDGVNAATVEKKGKEMGLSQNEIAGIMDVVNASAEGSSMTEKQRKHAEKITKSSGKELDGVVNIVKASFEGLNEQTVDSLRPLSKLTDEQFAKMKETITVTLKDMDMSTAENMLEAKQITQEEFDKIATIIDATTGGMSEETLKKIGPLLGITEEHLGKANVLIDESFKHINGEGAYFFNDIDKQTLGVASEEIKNTFADVEKKTSGFLGVMKDVFVVGLGSLCDWVKSGWDSLKSNWKQFWNQDWSFDQYKGPPTTNTYKPESNSYIPPSGGNGPSDADDSVVRFYNGDPTAVSHKARVIPIGGGGLQSIATASRIEKQYLEKSSNKDMGGNGPSEEESMSFDSLPACGVGKGKDDNHALHFGCGMKPKMEDRGGNGGFFGDGGSFNNVLTGIKNTITLAGNAVKDSTTKAKNKNKKKDTKKENNTNNVDYFNNEPVMGDFTGNSRSGGGGSSSVPATFNKFAYYSQADPAYSNFVFDHSPGKGKSKNPTLAARGCGPTSMAMVTTQLTGKKYLPTTLANLVQKWGYSSSAGTSWGFFPKAASHYGMSLSSAVKSESHLKDSLKAGKPVILSGRKKFGVSPFTTGGHFSVAVGLDGDKKVVINDPRGTGHSSASYNISDVISESDQQWAFKYNGGQLPEPDGDYVPNTSGGGQSGGPGGTSTVKHVGPLGQIVELVRKMNAKLFGLPWEEEVQNPGGTNNSPGGDSYSGGNSGPATSTEDAIIKKALELTAKGESGNVHHRVANDTDGKRQLSPSIGLIQMRGTYVNQMLNHMLKKAPNDAELKKWANYNWVAEANKGPWSQGRINELSNMFKRLGNVSDQSQREWAYDYIKNRNFGTVKTHAINTNKIKDARSIVHLTDIANTGPGLVAPFMKAFTADSGVSGDKFAHYNKEFRSSKSWWGRNSHLYGNRFNNMYNELKNWSPNVGGGNGDIDNVGGGNGGDDDFKAILHNIMSRKRSLKLTPRFKNPYENVITRFTKDGYVTENLDKPTKWKDTENVSESTINTSDRFNESSSEPKQEVASTMQSRLSSSPRPFNGGGNGDLDGTPLPRQQKAPTKPVDNSESKAVDKVAGEISSMVKNVEAKVPKLINDDNTSNSTQSCSDALLMQIVDLLKGLNVTGSEQLKVVAGLSSKEMEIINNNNIIIEKDANGNPIVINNNNISANKNSNPSRNVKTTTNNDVKYSNAKNIARGGLI